MHQPFPAAAKMLTASLPPASYVLTATLLCGSLFPLYLLMQYRGGEWLDVLMMVAVWAALVVLYWLPVGAVLFRWRGGWLARLFIGYAVSVPLYFLTVWLVVSLVTASMLPPYLALLPSTLGQWLAWACATPVLYLIVVMFYFLVRSGGTLSRIVQGGCAAVFVLAWIGTMFWMQSIDSYRGSARTSPVRADIVNVKIVDAAYNRVLEGLHVRIENGTIVQLIAAGADPGGWPLIDAQGGYLVPGLIDVHVHMQVPVFSTLQSVHDFDFEYMVESIMGNYAPQRRAFLENGVTTVRDLGGPAQRGFELRAALERQELLGPRMLEVGALVTSPHGHPVTTIWTGEVTRQGAILAADQASLVAGLERNYRLGPPDAVKIIYGTVNMAKEEISKELLGQAVAWARARHLMSVVHIGTTQEASDAVEAGATGIEHVSNIESLPDFLVASMLAHHTFADPTFGEYRTALLLSGITRDEAERKLKVKYALVRKLAAAGVTLTIGTDVPMVPMGEGYHEELEDFAKAGFTPAQILTFATVNNAAYLGKADEVGSIAAGHAADLVLVRDNPLESVSALRKPVWVMLGGEVVAGRASPAAD